MASRVFIVRTNHMRGAFTASALGGLCAFGLATASATAAAPSVQPVERPAAAVRAYWTRARMASAQPAEAAPTTLGTGASGLASRKRAARRSSLHERVTGTSTYPNRTNGRVFFTLVGGPDAGDYACSGTAVRSASHSLVWTAGHCVYDPGVLGSGEATNWEFVPAYSAGRKPFGEWPASSLATTPKWKGTGVLDGGDPAFDFGAATVAPRAGRHLDGVIGARRIAFGQPREKLYKAFGYPAESPPPEFDGRYLFRCRSPYRGSDNSVGPPPTIRISCDMTAGASGGGWVITRKDRGYVASVTSYSYDGHPNSLYGPYQGNAARALYRAAGG